jgi:hypothetical protein
MKIISHIILKYKEKNYEFDDTWDYEWATKEAMEFWWEDGEGSCDCNRSIQIAKYCDKNFEEMKCGDEIELVSISFD